MVLACHKLCNIFFPAHTHTDDCLKHLHIALKSLERSGNLREVFEGFVTRQNARDTLLKLSDLRRCGFFPRVSPWTHLRLLFSVSHVPNLESCKERSWFCSKPRELTNSLFLL